MPLVAKSHIMIVYKVDNLPILHPFQYLLEAEYLDLSSDGNYATIPLKINVLKHVLTQGHMCQLDTALYPTEKISWCIYILFIDSTNHLKLNCNYKVKKQINNIGSIIKKIYGQLVDCLQRKFK